jgi:ABC-type dipeptide/oligopeptide/nickel transport system ATPase component
VTFDYPTSKAKSPAISDLSFSITPGQLVVIVGPNGVGKSTLVKLLTRTHEPTSGTILIDGQDAQAFRLGDLREASAVLSQDHEILGGVTVAESVGLGRWQHKDDHDLVNEALRLGGAEDLIRKLEQGGDTVLCTAETKSFGALMRDGPLYPTWTQLEKETDVSGALILLLMVRLFTSRMDQQVVRNSDLSREYYMSSPNLSSVSDANV